jgi:hypothetical protein
VKNFDRKKNRKSKKIHHHVRLVISQRLSRDSHGGRLDVVAAAALVSPYRMRQSDAR